MPELPEVETIARSLSQGGRGGPSILGCEIKYAFLYWQRTLVEPDEASFIERIQGQTIEAIGRRAKYIIFKLSKDTLIIHLRMSGDLRVEADWENNQNKLLPHDRLLLPLSNNLALIFNDPRKFGKVWLTSSPEQILGKLGPEPLGIELTSGYFYQMLQDRHRQIKPLLMDQQFLAGLGNIYADEALFKARLHPLSISNEVSTEQAESLLKAIRDVLNEGIKRNGASIDWVYRGGDFQNMFNVYQRDGQNCYSCGSIIQRAVIGQRSTHFCPNCQKRPNNKVPERGQNQL
jgi:formamidopyrimidine-DNA glycosylase